MLTAEVDACSHVEVWATSFCRGARRRSRKVGERRRCSGAGVPERRRTEGLTHEGGCLDDDAVEVWVVECARTTGGDVTRRVQSLWGELGRAALLTGRSVGNAVAVHVSGGDGQTDAEVALDVCRRGSYRGRVPVGVLALAREAARRGVVELGVAGGLRTLVRGWATVDGRRRLGVGSVGIVEDAGGSGKHAGARRRDALEETVAEEAGGRGRSDA